MTRKFDYRAFQQIVQEVELGNGWGLETGSALIGFGDGKTSVNYWLRVKAISPDNDTGLMAPWTGRKYVLSQRATISEIIQTALLAYLTALEHEAREQFTWRGVRVFDPHLDVRWARQGKLAEATDARPSRKE